MYRTVFGACLPSATAKSKAVILSIMTLLLPVVSGSRCPCRAAGNLDEIRLRAFRLPAMIDTIEFTSSTSSKNRDESGVSVNVKGVMKYVAKDSRYRSETEAKSADTQMPGPTIAAFNGEVHQILDENKQTLTLSQIPHIVNPTSEFNPIALPYSWLFTRGDAFVWSEVKDEKKWQHRFSGARFVETRDVEGDLREIVDFPGIFDKTTTRVEFSQTLHYLPVRWSHRWNESEQPFSVVEVVEHQDIDVDGSPCLVPIHIIYYQEDDTGRSSGDIMINPGSLRVNHSVNDEVFTISQNRVKYINNIDEEQASLVIRGDRQSVGIEPNFFRKRPVSWLLVSNIGIILLLVTLLVFRHYRTGHNS